MRSDPQKRWLAHGDSPRGERLMLRRGIAKNGEGHMKGVKSIYMSGVEAGSAG
jgi:hypothetical protein